MATSVLSGTARRYAEAAFAVASESGDFDAWTSILDGLAAVLRNSDAQTLLTSPAVSASDKMSALGALLPAASGFGRNFLNILVERNRIGDAAGIARAFRDLENARRGILIAEVTTAVPLDPESEGVLKQRLGRYLGYDPSILEIRSRVDPSIIGGVVARVNDTLLDDSVRGRLERLRRTLTTAPR